MITTTQLTAQINPTHSRDLRSTNSIRLRAANLKQNQVLAALSEEELLIWQNNLEPVDLACGQVLYECESAVKHVYFPTTSIVSLMHDTAEGSSCEVALIGNDGAAGISTYMGGGAMAHSAVAQNEGLGFRMKVCMMKLAFDRSSEVRQLMLRYTQSLINQISQTIISNRYYSVEQQLSRRLLMGHDRLATDELKLTQEMLGNLIGVRRESVTGAANKLQEAGLITYARGRIVIKDRKGLEKRCHELYTPVPRRLRDETSFTRRDIDALRSSSSFAFTPA